MELIGIAEIIRQKNQLLNKRSIEIQQLFAGAGLKSCVLKGQGNALMYPNPMSRMTGDVDIWINGGRKVINEFVDSVVKNAHKGYKDVVFYYKDVFVEVHYFPTYLNRFSKNKILQQYIDENKTRQFTHYVRLDDKYELCFPTDDFNVIYQMCHLFNHFYCTGIGLRHFIDYYYLLKKVSCFEEVRENAIKQFRALGMDRFAKGVM